MKEDIDRIVEMVCRHYGVARDELLGPRRHRRFAWPRQVAMTLVWRCLPRVEMAELARYFGRDRTTVIAARKRFDMILLGSWRSTPNVARRHRQEAIVLRKLLRS